MSEVSGFATFVLRLAHDETGQLTGVVEHVATGEKARVRDVEGITTPADAVARPGGRTPAAKPKRGGSAMRRYTLIGVGIVLTAGLTAGCGDGSRSTPTASTASVHAALSPNVVTQLDQALRFAMDGTNLLIIWQRQGIIWQNPQTSPTHAPILDSYMMVNDILAGVPSGIILTPAVAGDLMGIRDQAQMAMGILDAFPPNPVRDATLVQVNMAIATTTGILGG